MKPVPFDVEKDLPPMPFDDALCRKAREMKRLGLAFKPHVGCFVWDPDGAIPADSPFPGRIYFILSLPRFIDIFGSVEAVAEKLVWLPTDHQAMLLCRRMGIDADVASGQFSEESLGHTYDRILRALRKDPAGSE